MIHVALPYLQQERVQAHQQTGSENTIAEQTNKTKGKKPAYLQSSSIMVAHDKNFKNCFRPPLTMQILKIGLGTTKILDKF